jgi:hypothetical protein
MKKVKLYISFLVLISLLHSAQNLFAQNSESYRLNTVTYKNLVNTLKKSKAYIVDTTNANYGGYENVILPYFDKDELKKRIKKDTLSGMTENGVFMLQQMFIGTLHYYIKKIPAKNLKSIQYSRSNSLDINWRKDSNEKEIVDIENSLLLLFKDQKKQINLISLIFNPRNNKIVHVQLFGYPKGYELDYLEKILEKK